jgi:hypothetical protein
VDTHSFFSKNILNQTNISALLLSDFNEIWNILVYYCTNPYILISIHTHRVRKWQSKQPKICSFSLNVREAAPVTLLAGGISAATLHKRSKSAEH